MKPTLTVFISGASDPAAHTDGIRPEIRDAPPMAALACRNRRRVSKTVLSPIHAPHNKKKAPGNAEALQDAFILKADKPPLVCC
jgi:hypothetical protein